MKLLKNESQEILDKVKLIADFISSVQKFTKLIPEVRTNIAVARPNAKSLEDVAGVDGRITIVQNMPKLAGPICFGAANHTGRLVLTAQKYDPSITAMINLRYSPDLIQKLTQQGRLSLMQIDRELQAKEIKQTEDSSMSWIIKQIYDKRHKIPDIVWDVGELGKEPMIRLFAKNELDLIKKLKLILKLVD